KYKLMCIHIEYKYIPGSLHTEVKTHEVHAVYIEYKYSAKTHVCVEAKYSRIELKTHVIEKGVKTSFELRYFNINNEEEDDDDDKE
ncbi:hypothetical protein OUZ56_032906, partial [Daphnia magna]